MRQTDPLFVALTKRETLGGGTFPYELSVFVTMAAMILLVVTKQWLVMGVCYTSVMVLMAVLQARDEDSFSILALKTRLWAQSQSRNVFYWRARSYKP